MLKPWLFGPFRGAVFGETKTLLLTQTVLLASLASAAGPPAVHATTLTAPLWAASFWSGSGPAPRAPWRTLSLSLCDPFAKATALECVPHLPSPWVRGSLAAPRYMPAELRLPRMSDDKVDEALGGFMHFDLVRALNLRAGPQVSWLTPESPREDLLELRVVAPGWGVRYAWDESPLSIGLSACTRFVMLGETGPVVDVLTAEARLELLLH